MFYGWMPGEMVGFVRQKLNSQNKEWYCRMRENITKNKRK